MKKIAAIQRQTKYCQKIRDVLAHKGHATNAELLAELHKSHACLSATTVHRATARLAERGLIAIAPPTHDGSMRYDTNIVPHDHFLCTSCGMLRDADIKETVVRILESHITDCHISGRLTIGGICKQCNYVPVMEVLNKPERNQ